MPAFANDPVRFLTIPQRQWAALDEMRAAREAWNAEQAARQLPPPSIDEIAARIAEPYDRRVQLLQELQPKLHGGNFGVSTGAFEQDMGQADAMLGRLDAGMSAAPRHMGSAVSGTLPGPGAVGVGMLPPQSRYGTYAELSDFLAQREGMPTAAERAQLAQVAEDSRNRVVQGFNEARGVPADQPYGMHELSRSNYDTFWSKNPQLLAARDRRLAKNREARQQYAQSQRLGAENPALTRERMVQQFFANDGGGAGRRNPWAAALLFGADNAARIMGAEAEIARSQDRMTPQQQAALKVLPALLENGQWKEANQMYLEAFWNGAPAAPAATPDAVPQAAGVPVTATSGDESSAGPFSPAPADPALAAALPPASDQGDVYETLAPMLDSITSSNADDQQLKAMLEANGITPEHLLSFTGYQPLFEWDHVGPLGFLPWLVAGEGRDEQELRARRQDRALQLLLKLYPDYGATP